MSKDSARILLKLLSGPNTGAEMELLPGDWVLGSDDDAQILLLDAGIRPRHLILRVDDFGSLTLIPQDGSVVADGVLLPPEGAAVQPFVVFTAGGTHAVYGPVDESWPSLSLPRLTESMAGVLAGSMTAAMPASGLQPETGIQPIADDHKVGSPLTTPETTGNKVSRSRLRRFLLPLVVILLLLGLMVDYTHLRFFFSDVSREAESLARSLHSRGFPDLNVTVRQDNTLLIHGAVPGNAYMDSLMRYVESLDTQPALAVISLEDLVGALRAKAQRADAPIRITRTGSLLRISGYAYDMRALEDLLAEERESLAAVSVRVDIVSWERAEKELRAQLSARGLDAKTRLIPDLYRIALQTRPLSATEQQTLRGFLLETEDFFGVEGVIGVERWRDVEKVVPRPPSRETALFAGPSVAEKPDVPTAQAPAAAKTEVAAQSDTTQEVLNLFPEALNELITPQEFSCGHLRIVGEGHDMGVLMGGVLYKTGAKMPDGMQVKLVSSGYVVLQRGKVHTRICTATETQNIP